MPVVIFFERLDLEQNASFMDGHSVSSGFLGFNLLKDTIPMLDIRLERYSQPNEKGVS